MSTVKGYNNDTLRKNNRGSVFQMIATQNGISRTDIAAACHLTKMSVSNITSDFLDRKLIVETKYTGDDYTTRKPIILTLSPDAPKVVGVLIHRSHIAAVLCDCQLNILRFESLPLDIDHCDAALLLETAFRVTNSVMAGQPVLGIGIGAIGPVDIRQGFILNPLNFNGIRDIPIVQLFQQRYGLPVFLDHHYNCVALAEMYFGHGRDYQNFMFLGITEGLSLSLITNNQLHTQFTGLSSEIGHFCVDPNGPLCSCGNHGCLGMMVRYDSEEHIQKTLEHLSIALSSLCNVLTPQIVIIGDELSMLTDQHLSILEEKLNRRLIIREYHHINVQRAFRAQNLEVSSCCMNVIAQIFNGNLLF